MWDSRQQRIILHCDWTAPCVRWHNGEGVSCRLYTLCNCSVDRLSYPFYYFQSCFGFVIVFFFFFLEISPFLFSFLAGAYFTKVQKIPICVCNWTSHSQLFDLSRRSERLDRSVFGRHIPHAIETCYPAGFENLQFTTVTCFAAMIHLWMRHDKYISFKHCLNILFLTLTHTLTDTHICIKACIIAG